MRCHAHNRKGEQCRKPAVPGRTVCHYHGGKTPVGAAAPAFKHGRYSKYLPKRWLERYEAALANPDLLALKDEIALIDLRIADLVEGATTPEKQAAVWPDLLAAIERRRRLTETEQQRLLAMQQAVTGEQAMIFVQAVASIVAEEVTDPAVRQAIARRLRDLAGTMPAALAYGGAW